MCLCVCVCDAVIGTSYISRYVRSFIIHDVTDFDKRLTNLSIISRYPDRKCESSLAEFAGFRLGTTSYIYIFIGYTMLSRIQTISFVIGGARIIGSI